MNKKIYSQVISSVILCSLIFTAFIATFTYYRNYQQNLDNSLQQIAEIYQAVESDISTSIAKKNLNLTQQVLARIKNSELISDAYFINNEQKFEHKLISLNHLKFSVKSIHDNTIKLGNIVIIPNNDNIKHKILHSAFNEIIILICYSIFMTLLILLIIHKILISPIKSISHTLHKIIPGEISRISAPKKHKQNEIGHLVKDINKLLDKVNHQIERERNLRNNTELLSNKFRLLFDKANVGIGLIDENNDLIIANPTLLGLLTQSFTVNIDSFEKLEFTQHFQYPQQITDFIENFRVKHGDQFCALDTKLSHKTKTNDKWIHCILSKVDKLNDTDERLIEVVLYDITARAKRELNIIYDAEHDMLTGLYNRRACIPKLDASLANAKTKSKNFAILMIDLDGFKDVNDTFGHDAGDKVIIEVSRRIKQYFRGTDVVCRWGGDEFLIGFSFDSKYETTIQEILIDLQKQVALPITIGREQTTRVGSSIGVSQFPTHGKNISALIDKADMAMYQVKKQGKNSFIIFQNNVNVNATH